MNLEDEFNKAQQALIDKFKVKLKNAAEVVLGELYSDVCNYAADDAHTNYHNYLRDEFKASLIREVTEQYSHYSWAHSIRMELLKLHPEQLQNKIISDLQDRIKSLEEHITSLRRYS